MTPGILALTLALGALGAVARYALQTLWRAGGNFRLAIVAVNIVGSTLAGALAALPASGLTLALIVGLCGSLTTVSTMVFHLLPTPHAPARGPRTWLALVHIGGSVGGCLAGFGVVSGVL